MRLANLKKDKYEIESGELYAKKYPSTFILPPLKKRKSLKNGDIVKLIFTMKQKNSDMMSFERMWVIVTGEEKGLYHGRLNNLPLGNVYITLNDEVIFSYEHVIDIYKGKTFSNDYNTLFK